MCAWIAVLLDEPCGGGCPPRSESLREQTCRDDGGVSRERGDRNDQRVGRRRLERGIRGRPCGRPCRLELVLQRGRDILTDALECLEPNAAALRTGDRARLGERISRAPRFEVRQRPGAGQLDDRGCELLALDDRGP